MFTLLIIFTCIYLIVMSAYIISINKRLATIEKVNRPKRVMYINLIGTKQTKKIKYIRIAIKQNERLYPHSILEDIN